MTMDNQGNNTHTYINNTTFSHENSLTHLLDTDEPEVEVANIKLSEYTDINTLSESLRSAKSSLSILSLNSQSLIAKFNDFQIAIEPLNRNNQISVICLQETWLSSESPTSLFDLLNYRLISRGKYFSNHGGLITYMCSILTKGSTCRNIPKANFFTAFYVSKYCFASFYILFFKNLSYKRLFFFIIM